MRSQLRAQQRPEPFHRVDVHFVEAVTVLITGVFAASMADRVVSVASGGQAGVDAILVRVGEGALRDHRLDDQLDRGPLHVGQHAQDHLAATLDRAEDGRLVLSSVPRPSALASLRRRPSRPFWPQPRAGLCARTRRRPRRSPPRLLAPPRAFRHQSAMQLLRHGMQVRPTKAQLLGDLPVGKVQAHQVRGTRLRSAAAGDARPARCR